MSPYNAHKKDRGFSLIEMLVALIIAGILTAISVPSLVGWYNQIKVKQAIDELEGALKEAQRQAMRKGKSCTVTINNTTKRITGHEGTTGTGNSNGCLLGDRRLWQKTEIDTNYTNPNPTKITFSYKGNTTNIGTIVVSTTEATNEKRCLVISSALGAMRTGFYQGDLSSIDAGNCSDP